MPENFYLKRLEALSDKMENGADSEKIRCEMQNIISLAFAEQAENDEICTEVVLKILRMLRKMQNEGNNSCEKIYMCELSELFECLTFCCEMLCAERGKRIFFTGGEREFYTLCSPRDLSWAFLNILSNAAAYSSGPYIGVTLSQNEKTTRISVVNEGVFDFDDFFRGVCRRGGGLFKANEIIRAHGGVLMMSSFSGKTDVSVFIPLQEDDKKPEYSIPYAEDLLYDRLSIVYTALSGI